MSQFRFQPFRDPECPGFCYDHLALPFLLCPYSFPPLRTQACASQATLPSATAKDLKFSGDQLRVHAGGHAIFAVLQSTGNDSRRCPLLPPRGEAPEGTAAHWPASSPPGSGPGFPRPCGFPPARPFLEKGIRPEPPRGAESPARGGPRPREGPGLRGP